jgi:hypothetical protein
MENKFLPLNYAEMLERMKYEDMLERMSSTTDPQYTGITEQFVSPVEPGPTEKLGDLIGKGLLKLPYVFEDERSAMRSGQDVANVLAFAPGPGNVLGYLEGRKLEEEGRPFLGSVIKAASVGLPGAGKAAGSVTTPPVKPAPTPKGIEHKILHTADRPSDMKNPSDIAQWEANYPDETARYNYTGNPYNPRPDEDSLIPLRYGENDTQMTSQIALFESDLYTAKNKNKLYPIENIFQAMRRYGVTGKGNVNQNVKRQIEDYISPEFIANNPKTTPASVMEELQKNAPNIQETHAYYDLASTMHPEVNSGYSSYTTRRPLYDLDSETTTLADSRAQTNRRYGERKFSMFDDGRIYGEKPEFVYRHSEDPRPNTTFINKDHEDLAAGHVMPASETMNANKYMHSRYTLEDIGDDANVYIKQESQSDAYGLGRDQDMITARLSGTDDTTRGSVDQLQYEMTNLGGPTDDVLYNRITLNGDNEAVGELLRTRDQTAGATLGPELYDHLVVTNKLDDFNKELGDLIRKGKEELDDQRSLIDSFTEGSGTYGEAGPEYDKALEEFNEMAERYRQRELRLLTRYSKDFYKTLEDTISTINLPRSADWFTDDFKLDLQTAVKNDSPYALFPNGPRSLAPPSGVTTIIPPKMIPFLEKQYRNSDNVKLNYDTEGKLINVQRYDPPQRVGGVDPDDPGTLTTILDAEPDPRSVNRAKSYNALYKKAIKQTEQDYGVKLNPTEYIDEYGQEYLKIILTPELKSSFQTFRMKHGGAASIIPLKYGF